MFINVHTERALKRSLDNFLQLPRIIFIIGFWFFSKEISFSSWLSRRPRKNKHEWQRNDNIRIEFCAGERTSKSFFFLFPWSFFSPFYQTWFLDFWISSFITSSLAGIRGPRPRRLSDWLTQLVKKLLPNRPFHNFRALISGKRWMLCSPETSLDRNRGSKLVNESVGYCCWCSLR